MSAPLPKSAPAPTSAPLVLAPSSKNRFITQFQLLSDSAVGGFFTHAREPHRVQRALREWAFINDAKFHEWDALLGWRSYGDDPEAKPKTVKMPDPVAAMKWIGDLDNDGKSSQNGVFLVHWPHFYIDKAPAIMQCIRHYCREFVTEPLRRLVLLVPEGAKLPKEIEHDMVQLDLDLPTREELRTIYESVIQSVSERFKGAPFNEDQVRQIVDIGAGMTESEFEVAVSKAVVENKASFPSVPLPDFVKGIAETKTAVVRKSDVLELMAAESMDNVAGLENLKQWLNQRRRCFTQEARDFGVDMPKGMVAIGPPGTGKSLIAKATAGTLGLPLVKFDISKVFNSLVGESESRVRAALKQLEAIAPCVVLVDEVDKAGVGGRGNNDSGVSQRILGAILTFQQENKDSIFWVMTANRPDSLPPELLRKGRMDEVWAVLPPNPVERLEVLKIHLRKRKQNPDTIEGLEDAVAASEGFVAAEVEAAVKEAVTVAFNDGVTITGQLIKKQLGQMKPISEAFKADFDAMHQWASDNARPASKPLEAAPRSRVTPAAPSGGNGRSVKV